MSEVLCGYGNCEEILAPKSQFKLTVTETRSGIISERKFFCCLEHGWRWLKERDERLNPRELKQ